MHDYERNKTAALRDNVDLTANVSIAVDLGPEKNGEVLVDGALNLYIAGQKVRHHFEVWVQYKGRHWEPSRPSKVWQDAVAGEVIRSSPKIQRDLTQFYPQR